MYSVYTITYYNNSMLLVTRTNRSEHAIKPSCMRGVYLTRMKEGCAGSVRSTPGWAITLTRGQFIANKLHITKPMSSICRFSVGSFYGFWRRARRNVRCLFYNGSFYRGADICCECLFAISENVNSWLLGYKMDVCFYGLTSVCTESYDR